MIHTAGETHASLAMHQPILAAIEKLGGRKPKTFDEFVSEEKSTFAA